MIFSLFFTHLTGGSIFNDHLLTWNCYIEFPVGHCVRYDNLIGLGLFKKYKNTNP